MSGCVLVAPSVDLRPTAALHDSMGKDLASRFRRRGHSTGPVSTLIVGEPGETRWITIDDYDSIESKEFVSLLGRLASRLGYAVPATEVVERAHDWTQVLKAVMGDWADPHVSLSPEGEIVFEWWRDPRKLTVYVGPSGVDYVKSWGPSMQSDMQDGSASELPQAQELWRWLKGA